MNRRTINQFVLLNIQILCAFGSCLFGYRNCQAEDQSLDFITSDHVSIHALYRKGGAAPQSRLIIVAPGYAQHSGTRSMQTLAMALTATADVVIVDFRGNGKSSGWFRFGSHEYLDLEPVLQWAAMYPDITLLGFSLGAYHCIRAASVYPAFAKRLLLVSCPTGVEDVVLSGGAFLNPIMLMLRKVDFQYQPQNELWFRMGWPFQKKPDSSVLVSTLVIPCHFLVGGRDTLVFERLSQKVYAAAHEPKSYLRLDQGVHAEQMFLQFPASFLIWLREKMEAAADKE